MVTKKTEKPEEAVQELEQAEVPAAPEAAMESKSVPDVSTETLVTQNENELLTLDELAQRHRVPAWQLGALLRFMGWAADKHVTDNEFTAALALLSGRPLGGGRR